MPTYCFVTQDTNEPVEMFLTVSECQSLKTKDGWKLPDGRMANRDHAAEMNGQKAGEHRGWPLLCEAGGVPIKQREWAIEKCKKAGVPTNFTKSGDAVITSPSHYKKYLKVMGLHDRSSYG